MQSSPALFVGIDVGTSGCRAVATDAEGHIHGRATTAMAAPDRSAEGISQAPELWRTAMLATLETLAKQIDGDTVAAIAIDGTSGTILLINEAGEPLGRALMYNDARALPQAQRVAAVAPNSASACQGPSASLAKYLWLRERLPTQETSWRAIHQADWLLGVLTGDFTVTDSNNALKTGFDPLASCWPTWFAKLGIELQSLPRVLSPGTPVALLRYDIANRLGWLRRPWVVAGTTDSTAAVIATGVSQAGEAVTSMGSTLVMKIITTKPIAHAGYGVYSQPLGEYWLTGGGSNSGGAVLRAFFSDAQLADLSARINPHRPSGLDYYPLLGPGERFPICDPQLQPRVSPRPPDDATFLQGLLEGMVNIEKLAYTRLMELGAPFPTRIVSIGGGAQNPQWTALRRAALGIPIEKALHDDAAYGSALLAKKGAEQVGNSQASALSER